MLDKMKMDPYWPIILAMILQKHFTFTKNHENFEPSN